MSVLQTDSRGYQVQAMPLGTSDDVAVGAGSTPSVAFGRNTRIIRVCADTDCRISPPGTAPVATSTSTRLPAGAIDHIPVRGGQKIAVIRESSDGTLNITEGGQ